MSYCSIPERGNILYHAITVNDAYDRYIKLYVTDDRDTSTPNKYELQYLKETAYDRQKVVEFNSFVDCVIKIRSDMKIIPYLKDYVSINISCNLKELYINIAPDKLPYSSRWREYNN